jgi:general secretion pathway protein E
MTSARDDASPAIAPPVDAAAPVAAPMSVVRAKLASERFLARIPREFSRAHLILSQGLSTVGAERLSVAATTSKSSVWNTGVRLGAPVVTEVADAEALARGIDEAYAARAPPKPTADAMPAVASGGAALEDLIREADQDLLQTQGKSRVVQLVDALLFEAVGRNASDIHVQPTDVATLVRYRVDGALATVRELPRSLAAPLLGRVKVMGRMDVAERRVPQDGRATVTIGDRAIDLRIGVFPTSYGERAVLRILDPTRRVDDLESLGMPADVRDRFLACTGRADGFVLVTGPTGAGKTTTLYAALKKIASPDLNVMTIEDPIEYDLAATGLPVSQSQVNLKKGVSFATGLRHLLRQDPDVILVGEIRDAETARMAIQSSLTGHLVLSTLHTNDAPSAVTRLVDLGVEPFLVSASLAAVLAQRLVRTIHRLCGGRGCVGCLSTGFLGRRGLYELMVIDENIQRLIARGADLNDLRAAARATGMRTLREEGQRLIAAGETTQVEVERVVQGAAT